MKDASHKVVNPVPLLWSNTVCGTTAATVSEEPFTERSTYKFYKARSLVVANGDRARIGDHVFYSVDDVGKPDVRDSVTN